MKKILFGTNNADKLREIRELLSGDYEVLGLKDLGIDLDVEETEPDLTGNAILKARVYVAASGLPCFADDTGLEVDALGGAPGVHSARYAGEQCSYADNLDKLVREMEGRENRKARFRTVVAWVDGEETKTFEGVVEGVLLEAPRGVGGFGYDPLFVPEEKRLTFAEMDPVSKNQISHRGRAIRAFIDFIRSR